MVDSSALQRPKKVAVTLSPNVGCARDAERTISFPPQVRQIWGSRLPKPRYRFTALSQSQPSTVEHFRNYIHLHLKGSHCNQSDLMATEQLYLCGWG